MKQIRALEELKRIVSEGSEFPDAEFKVREQFTLTDDDWRAVVEAYDA